MIFAYAILMYLVVFVGIVLFIAGLISLISPPSGPTEALDILAKRYATGEIKDDEYRKMMAAVKGSTHKRDLLVYGILLLLLAVIVIYFFKDMGIPWGFHFMMQGMSAP